MEASALSPVQPEQSRHPAVATLTGEPTYSSVSTSSSVTVSLTNPAAGTCGGTLTMAHDWTVHAEGLDMGTCYSAGSDLQALRIDPSGGSGTIGLTGLRFTLHGATW